MIQHGTGSVTFDVGNCCHDSPALSERKDSIEGPSYEEYSGSDSDWAKRVNRLVLQFRTLTKTKSTIRRFKETAGVLVTMCTYIQEHVGFVGSIMM